MGIVSGILILGSYVTGEHGGWSFESDQMEVSLRSEKTKFLGGLVRSLEEVRRMEGQKQQMVREKR
jgi:hypothetical protein